jgi:Kef-type K+ transport system membrane component KefB
MRASNEGRVSHMNIWIVAIIVFVFNLPFGYWRASVRKFSVQWILSIHLPVPFVIALRIFSGLGWQLMTFPVVIGAFFGGQFVGSSIYKRRHQSAGCGR